MSASRFYTHLPAVAALLWLLGASTLGAQTPGAPATPLGSQSTPTLDALAAEIRRLQLAIQALQSQLDDSRQQTAAVQQALEAMRDSLTEERDLLTAQISTLEQAKVESGSKYRVRVFGMALMQLVSARGTVDNIDLPSLAIEAVPGDSGGNISAAVRQSYLGVAVFGPPLGGAKTSADFTMDFFGGFPAANDGLSAASVRLRTLSLAAEGKRYSIRAGQEAVFFSPLSPTSLASTAYPALSQSGNIWAWTPQVSVERRIERPGSTEVNLRGGVLDSLTGELPAGEYSRLATAGERSRLPAFAGRVGWRRTRDDRVFSAGAAVYYARQNWKYERNVHAAAFTADWDWPLSDRVLVSGEFYRGRAIGGLGGGANSSVLFEGSATDPGSIVHPLRSTGGWTQVKLKTTPRLEFNGVFGLDRSRPRPTTATLEPPTDESPFAPSNSSAFINAIYQARSNIFFSVEYRRLWSTRIDGRAWLADHVTVSGGVAF